jgi:hypothetical protein
MIEPSLSALFWGSEVFPIRGNIKLFGKLTPLVFSIFVPEID